MVTVQWWVLPTLVLAGCGIARICTAIFVAAWYDRKLADQQVAEVAEPTGPIFSRPILVDTSLDAALGGLELPQEPHIEREWTPWDTGWAGEQTGAYAAVVVPVPEVAHEEPAGLASVRDRFRYPKLNGRLAKQVEGKKTLLTVTADGRSVSVRELILHGQEAAA